MAAAVAVVELELPATLRALTASVDLRIDAGVLAAGRLRTTARVLGPPGAPWLNSLSAASLATLTIADVRFLIDPVSSRDRIS